MSAKSYHSSVGGRTPSSYADGRDAPYIPVASSHPHDRDGFHDVAGELSERYHQVRLEPVSNEPLSPVVANLHPPTHMSALQWLAKVEQFRETIEHEMAKKEAACRDEFTPQSQQFDVGSVSVGSCFSLACRSAGVNVPAHVKSVRDMDAGDLMAMSAKPFKVAFTAYANDDPRNHIELVPLNTSNTLTHIKPVAATSHHFRVFVCTTVQHFFNRSNEWAQYAFYADVEGFGSALPFSGGQNNPAGDSVPVNSGPESIVGDQIKSGGSNVSGGVLRSRKRVIPSKTTALDGPIVKNYRTTNAVMFNNVSELFQDTISREYAQEIIEDLFETWGVPLDQPNAVKYAEDLLWTFLISVTASNKADYNRAYDVPVKPIEQGGEIVRKVEADFARLSMLLASKYGITRRQFARGVADDLKAFLKLEENQPLLPQLATRIGCEPLLAYLAFDGSTHCSNLTTRETTFTKTLESRNLFERDDVIAQGASDRLMQGMSGGVRAVSSR